MIGCLIALLLPMRWDVSRLVFMTRETTTAKLKAGTI